MTPGLLVRLGFVVMVLAFAAAHGQPPRSSVPTRTDRAHMPRVLVVAARMRGGGTPEGRLELQVADSIRAGLHAAWRSRVYLISRDDLRWLWAGDERFNSDCGAPTPGAEVTAAGRQLRADALVVVAVRRRDAGGVAVRATGRPVDPGLPAAGGPAVTVGAASVAAAARTVVRALVADTTRWWMPIRQGTGRRAAG